VDVSEYYLEKRQIYDNSMKQSKQEPAKLKKREEKETQKEKLQWKKNGFHKGK
jgi:hypothetical protein